MSDGKRTAWNSTLAPGKPLRRGGSLDRSSRLRRKTRLSPVNRDRRDKRRERDFGPPERRAWIRNLPCLACGATPSENAHVRSRGAGGRAEHIVPLCHAHHREQHQHGIETLQEEFGLDLHAEAARIEAAWQRRSGNG